MKQAGGYSWMYEQMSSQATRWSNWLTIATSVISLLVGSEGFLSIFTKPGSVPFPVAVISTLLSLTILLLVGIDKLSSLPVVRSEGLAANVSFGALSRSILYQLNLNPRDRQDARDFVKAILTEIGQLKLASPEIWKSVKKSYRLKFRDNPIFTPGAMWGSSSVSSSSLCSASLARSCGYDPPEGVSSWEDSLGELQSFSLGPVSRRDYSSGGSCSTADQGPRGIGASPTASLRTPGVPTREALEKMLAAYEPSQP